MSSNNMSSNNMYSVTSFPPIAKPSAQILILGSMPGVLSLKANQYYAHPRNTFWPIMGRLYGFNAELPYALRVEKLMAAHVAVWDVLQSCHRVGSLDSAIERGSRKANDFEWFFLQQPTIKLVAFNGAEAEQSFNTLVLPTLKLNNIVALNTGANLNTNINLNTLRFVRLPSTSPAHTLSIARKTIAWREALISA